MVASVLAAIAIYIYYTYYLCKLSAISQVLKSGFLLRGYGFFGFVFEPLPNK